MFRSYVLKLFRDYVFHSMDEVGNPVIDLTHVLAHLNKVSLIVRAVIRADRYLRPTHRWMKRSCWSRETTRVV